MFKLFPQPTKACSFADYGFLLNAYKGVKSLLEFGPGATTLAAIEAGVQEIVCLEYDMEWMNAAKERFKEYPNVKIGAFVNCPECPTTLPLEKTFEMAFVDSPKGYRNNGDPRLPKGGIVELPGMEDCSRLNTCLAALRHAPVVLLHDADRPRERATLGRLNSMGHRHWFVKVEPNWASVAKIKRKA